MAPDGGDVGRARLSNVLMSRLLCAMVFMAGLTTVLCGVAASSCSGEVNSYQLRMYDLSSKFKLKVKTTVR